LFKQKQLRETAVRPSVPGGLSLSWYRVPRGKIWTLMSDGHSFGGSSKESSDET